MSNLDRALALVAALSAALGVAAVASLLFNGATWPAIAAAAFPLLAVIAAMTATTLLSRRVETQRQSIETLKAHMATLARLVRESNDRASAVAVAPVSQTAISAPATAALAVPVPSAPVAPPAREQTADVEALGRIVADIADTVSNHEDRLVDHALRLDALNAPVSTSSATVQPSKSVQIANAMLGLRLSEPEPSAASTPEVAPVAAEPPAARTPPPDPVLSNRIKSALQANRFDLYLRPVVALPQRKTRIYEATIGVEHDGVTFSGGALSALCRRIGIGRQRDVLSLARLIRLARYFHLKGRNAPVFAEISDSATFSDKVFANLVEAMRAEAQVASILMLGVPQTILQALRPVEVEVLKAFARRRAPGRNGCDRSFHAAGSARCAWCPLCPGSCRGAGGGNRGGRRAQ